MSSIELGLKNVQHSHSSLRLYSQFQIQPGSTCMHHGLVIDDEYLARE
jgi:hypothetical protein